MQIIFDGHNDLLLRLWQDELNGKDPIAEFKQMSGKGHIDLKRAKEGGLAGGFCAIFVPPVDRVSPAPDATSGDFIRPQTKTLDREPALDATLAMASIALRLEQAGLWSLCRTVSDIESNLKSGTFAAILHIEGCEGIDENLRALDVLYAAGLRSLGPVWSRDNIFGHGVPFAYPSTPDIGPGLTNIGKNLVRACNRLGIMIDMSHMTEQGFWDVSHTSTKPLVATHSNAHGVTPASRNLTDRQLAAIGESQGVAGLNFAVSFLREDGQDVSQTGISAMVKHIDHMVKHAGIDCVALGSDFDGAMIPTEIATASGLQNLIAALVEGGYSSEQIDKICVRNWLRVLSKTWN